MYMSKLWAVRAEEEEEGTHGVDGIVGDAVREGEAGGSGTEADDNKSLMDEDVDVTTTAEEEEEEDEEEENEEEDVELVVGIDDVDDAANDINNDVVFIPLDVLSTMAKVLVLLKPVE